MNNQQQLIVRKSCLHQFCATNSLSLTLSWKSKLTQRKKKPPIIGFHSSRIPEEDQHRLTTAGQDDKTHILVRPVLLVLVNWILKSKSELGMWRPIPFPCGLYWSDDPSTAPKFRGLAENLRCWRDSRCLCCPLQLIESRSASSEGQSLKLVLLLLAAPSSSSAVKVPISFACLRVHGWMGIPRHLLQLRTWGCSLASYQLQELFLPSILLLLLLLLIPSTVFWFASHEPAW